MILSLEGGNRLLFTTSEFQGFPIDGAPGSLASITRDSVQF